MSKILQPILEPVNGAPDIVLSIDPANPDELFVFLGLAMLEKVPHLREHPVFKMLLARLHNGGVCGQRLTDTFGVARSTLRRWGYALRSGDLDRIRDAFSGQGAARKVTPEIDRYVRDRFGDLHGQCRNYSKVIRLEVAKYFKQPLSAERLRWIFKDERQKLASIPEDDGVAEASKGVDPTAQENDGDGCGANSCERCDEKAAIGSFLPATRNYSLQSLPGSGRAVPETPTLCHHAGVLLMSHWIDRLTADWPVQPDLVRQWVVQVLLGAVNHEQSKRLSFSSLCWLIGPTIRSINHQRHLLSDLAAIEHTHAMFQRNGRLLDLSGRDLFYFDPHAAEYTGQIKTLKGWSGGLHRVDKIINMDFIHTEDGAPCFVQHADNFYDMRERFFMAIHAFRGILGDVRRPLTWVADRGLYGLDTLLRIVDECTDHFITWEKNYKGDGWNESAGAHTFDEIKKRNNIGDLLCYRFRWQEHPWPREPRFQRMIVRAHNPAGRQIEVAILTSDPERERRSVIGAMFNRWLQENDFGYMDRHVGINELTSRSHETYASISESLDDRYVLSRQYKTFRREKMRAESALKRLLLKRAKQHDVHVGKARIDLGEQRKLKRQIKKLSESPLGAKQQRELRKRRCAQQRLVVKHEANKTQRAEKEAELNQLIDKQTREVRDAEKRMAESVREESRLQALIDEQYLRLDTRRKAFMDAIRISSRNIFANLAMAFRPLYNNYRDDHFIARELSRAPGIIYKRDGTAHVMLMPAMQFQPAVRDVVQSFLSLISWQINEHFDGRYMPIKIALLDKNSNDLDIDRCSLKWVSSPS